LRREHDGVLQISLFFKFIMRMEIAAGVTPIPFGKVVEDRKKP
jgi:hypothetical protein